MGGLRPAKPAGQLACLLGLVGEGGINKSGTKAPLLDQDMTAGVIIGWSVLGWLSGMPWRWLGRLDGGLGTEWQIWLACPSCGDIRRFDALLQDIMEQYQILEWFCRIYWGAAGGGIARGGERWAPSRQRRSEILHFIPVLFLMEIYVFIPMP